MCEQKTEEQLDLTIFGTASLASMIAAVRSAGPRCEVIIDVLGLVPLPKVHSYRGYYEHLAIGFGLNGRTTTSELLETLEAANGQTFEGYKGGFYHMTGDTPVWLANPGETGRRIVGFEPGICCWIKTEADD